MILTLAFSFGLCLLGPVGSGPEDPLTQWLVRSLALAPGGQQSLPVGAGPAAPATATLTAHALLEWTTGLLAGPPAAVFMARLALPLALIASGLLALVFLAFPLLVYVLSGALATSSVPLASIAFGMAAAGLLTVEKSGNPASGPRMPYTPAASRRARKGRPPTSGKGSYASALPDDAPSPPPAEKPGPARNPSIGRYEIIRPIGKGAMGEVFLGRDPHINRLTAIKTVRFEESFAEEDVEQIKSKFFREAESAGALSHPHIVTIYDAGEDGDTAYIAMEFLEGSTLLRFAKRRHLLPLRRLIRYMVQVAEALDYAHGQGVVHRDIKPANIMLMPSGQIKLTDFGIAHVATSSRTQTGVVKGTPYYMSPEQFAGLKVDGRSDIFSLGTTLFQLLTGTLPFYAESPALLMNQIIHFPHPNPRAINPRVIPAINVIVDRMLAKDLDQRYQAARDLAADLLHLDRRIGAVLSRNHRSHLRNPHAG